MMSGGVSGMESSSSGSDGATAAGVAPFVAKTYGMVDDRATDAVVAWGPAGNSFVVADFFAFSQALLPANFKHANFASFVRQVNTYGFCKVDPDRWEFAHASFLRGQTHLLPRIVRRRSGRRAKDDVGCGADDADADSRAMVAMEVVRLRQEQKATEDRMAAMSRRVQDAERRPKQMLAFLLKVVGDPDVLRRLAGSSGSGQDEGAEIKRPRLLLDSKESVDSAGVNGLLYDHSNLNQEEALVPEPSVDLYYAGGDGFGDVQAEGPPPYAFHMDSSGQDEGARLLLDSSEAQRMSVDGGGVDELLYDSSLNLEEAFVPEPSVDLYDSSLNLNLWFGPPRPVVAGTSLFTGTPNIRLNYPAICKDMG